MTASEIADVLTLAERQALMAARDRPATGEHIARLRALGLIDPDLDLSIRGALVLEAIARAETRRVEPPPHEHRRAAEASGRAIIDMDGLHAALE